MNTIRIIIADDHELVREGLRAILEEDPAFRVIGEARQGEEAVSMIRSLKPDVVLLDLMMPLLDGIEVARIVRQDPSLTCRILMLTSFLDAEKVRNAIQAGAVGYLLKDVRKDDLFLAIKDASEGNPTLHPDAVRALLDHVNARKSPSPIQDLTLREVDVLKLIAKGKSNKEIGASLSLTEGTVKGYVSAIFTKIGVQDRTQAALFAIKVWPELSQ